MMNCCDRIGAVTSAIKEADIVPIPELATLVCNYVEAHGLIKPTPGPFPTSFYYADHAGAPTTLQAIRYFPEAISVYKILDWKWHTVDNEWAHGIIFQNARQVIKRQTATRGTLLQLTVQYKTYPPTSMCITGLDSANEVEVAHLLYHYGTPAVYQSICRTTYRN